MSAPVASTGLSGIVASPLSVLRACAVMAGLSLAVAACAGTEIVNVEAMRGYQACDPDESPGAPAGACERSRNVLLAMASGKDIAPEDMVREEVLEVQRGGFIVAGRHLVDFGFRFETLVNGVPQLTSVLSYRDILNGNGSIPNLSSIQIAGDGGSTQIIHSGGPKGIGASIVNSQSGVNINNISTLAIEIINLQQIRRGGADIGKGRPLPLEMHQSVVNGLQ